MNAAGPSTLPDRREENASSTGLITETVHFLRKPTEDVWEALREAGALRLFWADIGTRPKAYAHQGIVVAGFLVALIEAVSCVLMQIDETQPLIFIHFVIVERCISSVSQIIFSTRGATIENGPLLIVANLNALAIVLRSAIKIMMYEVPNYTLLALLSAVVIAHLAATISTFRGGLERFEVFMIGGEPHILRMYRRYRLFVAIALLDFEMTILVTSALFFFMKDYYKWYWIVFFGVMCFVVLAVSAVTRSFIRRERSARHFSLVVLFDLLFPVAVLVAVYNRAFIGIEVDGDSQTLVYASIAIFLAVRVALLAAMWGCFSNFGNGMKEAFEEERDAVGFVRERAKRAEAQRRMIEDLEAGREPQTDSAYGTLH